MLSETGGKKNFTRSARLFIPFWWPMENHPSPSYLSITTEQNVTWPNVFTSPNLHITSYCAKCIYQKNEKKILSGLCASHFTNKHFHILRQSQSILYNYYAVFFVDFEIDIYREIFSPVRLRTICWTLWILDLGLKYFQK